jgi:ABC-type polysaccharide/polyol phosphate transport system ATPase subunit
MSGPVAIRISRVTKTFDRSGPEARGLGRLLSRVRKPPSGRRLRAVDDVSLDIPRGRALGILGSNGAGKSTLLGLIAGISQPSSGTIETNGRLLPLLELGAGFHPELSGHDNILLQGSLYGIGRRRMEALAPDIIAFAGVGDFIHMPVKHYSSGMRLRLGFSISAHLEPDILLIDEAFSVGDLDFHNKCVDVMERFHQRGGTFLLVSHSVALVEQVCDEAIWMDAGRVVRRGPPAEVGYHYRKFMFEKSHPLPTPLHHIGQVASGQEGRFGSGCVVFDFVEFLDADGAPRNLFRNGESLTIRLRYHNVAAVRGDMDCVLNFFSYKGHAPYCLSNEITRQRLEPDPQSGMIECRIDRLDLTPGLYYSVFSLCRAGDTSVDGVYDMHARIYNITIAPDPKKSQTAALDPPARWEKE